MNKSKKTVIKLIPLITVFIFLISGLTWYINTTINSIKMIPFSSVEKIIKQQEGKTVSITEQQDGRVYLKAGDTQYRSQVPPNSQVIDKLIEKYNIDYTYSTSTRYGKWVMGGFILLLAIVGYFLQKSKGGFGLRTMKNSVSQARPLPLINLKDVGGLGEEMKQEILQTLTIIKEPERARKLGITPPKGILLYGPPGTGKTLLAQAMAKELNATFFTASGSAFNELFIGVGASRVRSLFKAARKERPAVIFIDEVDALAGKRKPHGGEEAEKTLTELLVQLDGGTSNEGILFIAATNRKDMLDDAFLRPGRIDFTFHVPLPDTKGRQEIIDIHAKGKSMAPDALAALDQLAESTSGLSGADLYSLFETASRRAVLNRHDALQKEDLDFALDRTILGSSSRSLTDQETRRRVAIHEAGHALVASLTKQDSVRKATIIPRGEALGYVAPNQKELQLSTTSDLLDRVAMILAGGAAERFVLGEHSIGVSGDVQQAKQIIEHMVEIGMLEDGFSLTFKKLDREEKMQELFQKALYRAENLISTHQQAYQKLVDILLKKETIEGSEVEKIVRGTEIIPLTN
ncbi:AAA family ATPase [Neobacillus dielmonensis]|uniref:AAA family ATPase n=1 Tax=Neobacillus dielmonensis TaxID=1347369 RepID=UPI0005A89A18|nr:AAA family ATPase [Neobacillus dielmonensis]